MCGVYREELPQEVTSGEKEVTRQMKDKDAVDAEVTAKLKPLYRKYAKEHPEVSFDEFKNFSRDKLKSIGRRFTMDIKFGESFQLFLNPNPTTLNEKMQRMKSGEILFCELAKD